MPAIQVAKTDTFEILRQKVNQIGSGLFSISAGGSDLSAGNIKLGDGTRPIPSLAFTSDSSLGVYKSANKTLGFVSAGKKIADFSDTVIYSFKDLILQQKRLVQSGISITNNGSNYDAGNYNSVPVLGGSGENATANIAVTEFIGSITNDGANYFEGSYASIPLTGGSGSGATANFSVDGIDGTLTAGSGYKPGTYTEVPLTGGSGTGAEADITITGDTILNGSITSPGTNYSPGSYPFVQLFNVPTQTYTVTSVPNPGTPPPNSVYQINGTTQQVLTLVIGNTYRFDVSDSSVLTHPLTFQNTDGTGLSNDYIFITKGTAGTAGAFVDFIIKPTATAGTIKYNCSAHDGMGAAINIITGTAGSYGSNAYAALTVDGSGAITNLNFVSGGQDYKATDVLNVISTDLGGGVSGVGFEYTISGITYTGTVNNILITNNGQDYENGDILSASSANLGGVGSGFQYNITTDPGVVKNFNFVSKGVNYEINDILQFPSSVNNVSTFLPGQLTGISTTLSNSSAIITVSDTSQIIAGMFVSTSIGDVGVLSPQTTVLSVDSLTQLTLSAVPTTSGSALLNFTTPSLIQITVNSTNGIRIGYSVSKVSGVGVLAPNTTVSNVNSSTNTITLSAQPTTVGNVVLNFVPPYGNPTTNFQYSISNLGVISSFDINNGGNGYSVNDILTINASDLTQPITYYVSNKSVQKLSFVQSISSSTLSVGDFIKERDGGVNAQTITTSTVVGTGGVYTNVATTTSGNGVGATFNVNRDGTGTISQVSISSIGYFYEVDDTITIDGSLVGGVSSTDDIIITVTNVSQSTPLEILKVNSTLGVIDSLLVENIQATALVDGDFVVKDNTITPIYEVNTASSIGYRYYIDSGSGPVLTPNLTLYSGSTYEFDITDSSNQGHIFSFSEFRDGTWSPSNIQNITATLVSGSSQVSVSSTTGILPGMRLTKVSGDGQFIVPTSVVSVDNANQITIDTLPTAAGTVVVNFSGYEYTNGVTRSNNAVTIKITDDTPNLYYYCGSNPESAHGDEGGENNQEALITTDNNNPKVFGSGFSLTVSQLNSQDIVSANILTGEVSAVSFDGDSANISIITAPTSITTPAGAISTLSTSTINSAGNLTVTPATIFSGAITANSTITATGNITTSGILRTNNSLNVNNILTILDNNISTSSGNDIQLSPPVGRVARVNSTTALTIPAGTTAQRPTGSVVSNGAIRFNTETGQYEGYSGATSSWSSLGGVRDLDGNTYIAAEASIGANDNTLYFFNDNQNTIRVTPSFFDFRTVKKIRSFNTSAPNSTEWAANTPVVLGSYVKYRNNIYEVTVAGTTGGPATPPIHTSGSLSNGTATLTWHISAVSTLAFDEIAELQVGPLGNLPLVVNGELRFADNIISTDVEDLIIRPNSGKKITLDAETSLVIPAGDSNSRGVAAQGSIRYNTTITQFEGYNGANWTSLGGVKDVDGNTYIIPETAPGANENILYFYNDGNNTLQLSTSALNFRTISTITSSSQSLALDVDTVSFNAFNASLTTTGTSTYLSSTQTNLDFGLSVGVVNNYLLRLNTDGDFIVNKGFGTSVITPIKVLDNTLKDFELDDVYISTSDIQLTKDTVNSGSSVVYSPATASGAKVIVSAYNSSTNDKEIIEFTVTDKITDIYNTEIGTVRTGEILIIPTFDFDASNNVRLSVTLNSSLAAGNIVNITVVRTIIKK